MEYVDRSVHRSHKKKPDVNRPHMKNLCVHKTRATKKKTKKGLGLSRKRRAYRPRHAQPLLNEHSRPPQIIEETPVHIEYTVQVESPQYEEVTLDDSEHETSEDEQDTASIAEITEKIKIVNIFATAVGVDHVDMITTCWCAGLRVHKSCALKLDIPDGIQLCLFDGGPNGVCTSDCISCVPCIVCHKTKDTDTETSLSTDFPDGDNWLLREEKACPSCLAKIHVDSDEVRCKFCNVGYEENAGSM
jgi:hypothetical protein